MNSVTLNDDKGGLAMAVADSERTIKCTRPGRKPVFVNPVRKSAYLERDAYEGIRSLGDGSFSQGVCYLWLIYSASRNTNPMSNED